IVSDTGEIEQVVGAEYVHVAVRFLDGPFLKILEISYDFNNMHFSLTDEADERKAALPLVTNDGSDMGFVVWEPYRPGQDFLTSIAPVLLTIFFLLGGVVSIFIAMLYHRAMANRDQETRIRYLASHDSLTGLLNRASFETLLDAALRE